VKYLNEEDTDIKYQAARRNALNDLKSIEGMMLDKIVERDNTFDALREKYVKYVLGSTELIGIDEDLIKKLGVYDVMREQVNGGKIAPYDAQQQLVFLKREYEECKKNLENLEKFNRMFINASNGFIELLTKFDEGRGSGELRENYEKKIRLRHNLLKGKIKENYSSISKLFD
jgi:hypothetical protein